ncbi:MULTISPECIES: oxidoreductase [unclassified Streptomyces]|uniref:oxidoreductase n=1 Tax=unclassified Streptomyces TaxID=2593676 RepID=UPI001BE9EEB0|nr:MULTISPECIES: oxidoreductase [unclassified Streptomyces]MBT2405979.1 oxidoreductase [Streptomyces sp. ISL-21]MBT2453900.1 oxidoreductase [Streptomyces sp. ISL-86]MBT2608575.1 oxidoreductase [Streptomyces sp. ISL-87]
MTEVRTEGEPSDLGNAELLMWRSYRTGSVCDLSTRSGDLDNPHSDLVWGPERSVRAEIVALLLLHGPGPVPGRVASLKLRGVRITGRLDLSGGTVQPYVELQSCRFDSEIQLSETRFGTLRMVNCAIPRLEAARLHTEGDLHLPRCRVARGIRLTDAQIGTDLLVSQAVVQRDNKGRAIAADGLSVAQDFQGELLETYGEVSLRGAKIGVSMNLRGARLRNPYGRRALNAPQLTVERTLYLTSIAMDYVPGGAGSSTPPYGIAQTPTPTRGQRAQRFECRGGLRLDDGRFGDAVDFYGARFTLTAEQEVSLRRIQTPELRFVGERPEHGRVVLSGAKVVKLVDTSTSWPGPGGVSIEGFAYENLAPRGHFPLSRRLDWVEAATPEYSPEPYERLAAVLRASGEDADAREVLLAKQRRRRATLPPAAKAWGHLQDWTVVYGYRPGRAALWMAVLWAAGAVLFSRLHPEAIKPDEHPEWDPALYALDLLLPVIDLGQEGQWKLVGAWQWGATALVMLGWILATTVAAGASRLLRRG